MEGFKGSKGQRFIDLWVKQFKGVLEKAILKELGYTELHGYVVQLVKPPTPQWYQKQDEAHLRTLESFRKEFRTLCRKKGVILIQEKWPLPTVDLESACRWFDGFLARHAEHEKRKGRKIRPERRRARIPVEVAIELVRLLNHFCGNPQGLERVRSMFAPSGRLNSLFCRVEFRARRRVIRTLRRDLRDYKTRLVDIKSPRARGRIFKHISYYESELKRVEKKKVTWNFVRLRGSPNGTMWANNWKDDLFKVIISKDQPKIIKRLSPEMREKKKKFFDNL